MTRLAELSNPPARRSPLFRRGTPVCDEWTLGLIPDRPAQVAQLGLGLRDLIVSLQLWAPSLFEVGQAGSAGHCALRSGGAGRERPGDASPGPFPPAGPGCLPLPSGFPSAGANQPLPPCPGQIHPQTCAQRAGMRQWLPDVHADA